MTFLPTKEHVRQRVRKTGAGRAVRARLLARAAAHRRSLVSTRVVGVTGSSGKTTTKELIAEVLSTQLRGTKTPQTSNTIEVAARTILDTSPADDFCVLELAAAQRGSIADMAQLVRPEIAVVTTVGREHQKFLESAAGVAAEKRHLVEAATDVAVLNADDPLVLAMREAARGEVVTIGLAEDADFRAVDVRAAWPDRLTFTVEHAGRSLPVATRLCGAHWTPSVLAALAVGKLMGVPLETAARAVEAFEPIAGRMSPVVRDGITFIRDEWKAPQWSVGLGIDYIAEARVPSRRVIVLGWISNYAEPLSSLYGAIVERALAAADEVVLVGTLPLSAGLPARDRVRLFPFVRDAARYLGETLGEGDLVLLKGIDDHLQRIILARETPVRCWRERCGRRVFCESCYLLRFPARPRPATTEELEKWARV